MIWTSSDWFVGVTAGYPQSQISMMVPLDPALAGVRLYQQWLIDWRLNYQGSIDGALYFSNGGVLTLGF